MGRVLKELVLTDKVLAERRNFDAVARLTAPKLIKGSELHRICGHCELPRPFEDFIQNADCPGGTRERCKLCHAGITAHRKIVFREPLVDDTIQSETKQYIIKHMLGVGSPIRNEFYRTCVACNASRPERFFPKIKEHRSDTCKFCGSVGTRLLINKKGALLVDLSKLFTVLGKPTECSWHGCHNPPTRTVPYNLDDPSSTKYFCNECFRKWKQKYSQHLGILRCDQGHKDLSDINLDSLVFLGSRSNGDREIYGWKQKE